MLHVLRSFVVMPATRTTYRMFADLPVGVRAFLLSSDFDSNLAIVAQHASLNDDQIDKLSKMLIATAFNDLSLLEAVEKLKFDLVPVSMHEEGWSGFLAGILQVAVWPLRELYGDELTSVLDRYKISTTGWPETHILLKPLSYSGVVSEISNRVGMTLMSQQQRDRLRELLVSKIKGIRTDEQILEVLQRQVDLGGLGIESDLAKRIMMEMGRLVGTVQILSEDEYSDWLSASRKPKIVPEDVAAKPLTEDESEIAAISAQMQKPMNSPQSVLDQAVETTFASLSTKPADEYSAKRLRYIISSRLRDVRNTIELTQLLMRDTKVGGMGYDQATADATVKQIEAQYAAFHSSIMQDEKAKLEQQMQEQSVKVTERKKREAEEHAKWYQEKIASRKQIEDENKQVADRMKQAFAAVHPMDVKERATEEQRFGKMVPAVASGAAVPVGAAQVIPSPVSPFTQAKVAPAVASQEVKVSKATADLQTVAAQSKPRLDDVKYGGPRLTGPIQELKEMSIIEFRRLSKDPEAAIQKIMQRIDILNQESLERRIEGIRAWQSCPLQQAYIHLMSEAFQKAKPVAQLADEKRAAGEECPTPTEIAAIISLNSKLHF